MTEENNQESSSIRDEFRNLGNALKGMLDAAWESEERKKLQSEIEEGMYELGVVLDSMAEDIRNGEAGQKIKKEVDDFSERVRSGEVESKAREEVVKALQFLNTELEKVSEKLSETEEAEE
jgi:hypothetical protein